MTDQLDEFGRLYAEVRQRLIDTASPPMERLTDAQRLTVDYERQRRSPLGNWTYSGPRSTDPQDQPLPYMSPEEIRQQPEYGILRRILETKKEQSNV
jgi:hypothetical protein